MHHASDYGFSIDGQLPAATFNPRSPPYVDRQERLAYSIGYSDGYYGRAHDPDQLPRNAYSRGYNEGANDNVL